MYLSVVVIDSRLFLCPEHLGHVTGHRLHGLGKTILTTLEKLSLHIVIYKIIYVVLLICENKFAPAFTNVFNHFKVILEIM